jgi:SAM-dependent methyltransferase
MGSMRAARSAGRVAAIVRPQASRRGLRHDPDTCIDAALGGRESPSTRDRNVEHVDSPTRSLARRFAGSLRSRGALRFARAFVQPTAQRPLPRTTGHSAIFISERTGRMGEGWQIMTEPVFQEQIDAAMAYDTIMVPAMMEDWAVKVADAVELRPGQRVLDVACGTGVVSRTAVARVGPTGAVTGLDANLGMLTVAARRAPAIAWTHGAAGELPFGTAAFDAVVSQFGLMFFPDRRRAIAEMLRVLVRGGRCAVAVWNSLETIPAYATEVELLERLAGTRAADALRAPFVLGDRDALAAHFRDAGAADVRVATDRATARFPSLRTLLEADLRGWLPVMGVPLPEDTIQAIVRQAERDMAAYVGPDGTLAFEQSAHIVTATAP